MDIVGLLVSLLPLIVVFLGIVWLKKSGSLMVIVALVLTAFLTWWYFQTGVDVIVGGIIMGILKSLGISLAIIFAMFLVFLMQITGALNSISDAVHKVAGSKEEKALFVGMGFGSFVTALGLVTPTLFPPLLVAMGFSPLAAITIACLGYDPLCSFALLSLPIAAPVGAVAAMGVHITTQAFAENIVVFLPAVSVLFAFAMLWVVGGIGAIKRSWLPALISGLVISLSALVMVFWSLVPISLVGVAAGGLSMLSLYLYNTVRAALARKPGDMQAPAGDKPVLPVKSITNALSVALFVIVLLSEVSAVYSSKFGLNIETCAQVLVLIALTILLVWDYRATRRLTSVSADGGTKNVSISLLRSLLPWIFLIVAVSIVNIPSIYTSLKNLPGSLEVITAFANQTVDLDFLTQAYTWIFVTAIFAVFALGASRAQVKKALDTTVRRFLGPFLAYSLFFSIAYLMFYSGGSIVAGKFVGTTNASMNMDMIIGASLATIFGAYYGLVAPLPGFIGSVIGGSETSSNVMFAKIQNIAVGQTIGADKFNLAFGSLAVAGGIASAVTPSKIHNACATLGEGGKMESEVMKVNIGVAVALTLVTCILTFLFLKIGLGF